jgi:hypothetical protein
LRQLIKAGATPQSRFASPPKQEGGFRPPILLRGIQSDA